MWFGTVALPDSPGCILAHSLSIGGRKVRKGVVIDAALLARLSEAGITEVVVARIDESDVHEDQAAEQLAAAIAGTGVVVDRASTGRVNLFAAHEGLLCFDRAAIQAVNSVDEAITLATLPQDSWVLPGKMIATSKVISYAVPSAQLSSAIGNITHRITVAPVRSHRACLIQTRLPTIKTSVLDKTRSVTQRRLAARNVTLTNEKRCDHNIDELTALLCSQENTDWILIAGASAISDRGDVIPQAIIAAGGSITRYGIPVDPCNLLLLGELHGRTVIGLPGCARSPKLNGLDLLLNRLACNTEITSEWLNGLSVGGLLGEMHDRPQPRVSPLSKKSTRIAALVLAAGTSKRAGAQNKLLFEVNGVPIVEKVLEHVTGSSFSEVHVVTGHEHQQVERALAQSKCTIHYCANYEMGMAHSLSYGISRLGDVDAVMVFLGDMPDVSTALIDQLLSHELSVLSDNITVPVYHGERGNPVIVGRSFFDTLLQHTGDTGARFLMRQYPELVVEVPVQEPGVLMDYDTPEALATLNQEH